MRIVSFSGGKDSTAMLLMMLDKGMPIDKIVFCDTGMEFPQMYAHIEKVEKYIGRTIYILKGKETYRFYLCDHVNQNFQVFYFHPYFRNRWCTRALKVQPFMKYIRQFNDVIEYHGIAADESYRTLKNQDSGRIIKYPLVEWGITEKQALEYCYNKGFDWGGLYKKFHRVSCWCCPLKRISEYRVLYNDYPELWAELVEMDKKSFRKFLKNYTVQELGARFANENNKLFIEQELGLEEEL